MIYVVIHEHLLAGTGLVHKPALPLATAVYSPEIKDGPAHEISAPPGSFHDSFIMQSPASLAFTEDREIGV